MDRTVRRAGAESGAAKPLYLLTLVSPSRPDQDPRFSPPNLAAHTRSNPAKHVLSEKCDDRLFSSLVVFLLSQLHNSTISRLQLLSCSQQLRKATACFAHSRSAFSSSSFRLLSSPLLYSPPKPPSNHPPTMAPTKNSRKDHDDHKGDAPAEKKNGHGSAKMRRGASQQTHAASRELPPAPTSAPAQAPTEPLLPSVRQIAFLVFLAVIFHCTVPTTRKSPRATRYPTNSVTDGKSHSFPGPPLSDDPSTPTSANTN